MAASIIRAVLICLSIAFSSAHAQTFGLHTVSVHEHHGFNNTNPGLYYRADNGFTAGFYRNSYRKQSAYVAWTFETDEWHGLTAAASIGGVTGYPDAAITPMLVPSVALHIGASAARIGIVPRPPKTGAAAALHLMFEHHF